MDPAANLRRQRELAAEAMAIWDRCLTDTGAYLPGDEAAMAEIGRELGELVQALDEWRNKGGFDPYLYEEQKGGDTCVVAQLLSRTRPTP